MNEVGLVPACLGPLIQTLVFALLLHSFAALVSTFISQLSFDTTYCSNLLLIILLVLDRFQTSNKTTYKTENDHLINDKIMRKKKHPPFKYTISSFRD